MTQRLFVNCKDYSGFKNVKFIMEQDDFDHRNTLYEEDNYELVRISFFSRCS